MFQVLRYLQYKNGKQRVTTHGYLAREEAIFYARRYSKMSGFIRCDVLDEDGNRVYRLTADGTENFALVPAED